MPASADRSAMRDPAEDGRVCCCCGGRTFRKLHEWEVGHRRNPASIPLAYWQCQCELAFLHPVPTAAQLPDNGDWFSPQWQAQQQANFRRKQFKKMRLAVQRLLFGEAQARFGWQTRRACPSGRLLDVGCGAGAILQRMSSHFTCEGVEPSPTAAALARKLGFTIHEALFEDVRLPEESYDVVMMDSVIEHVADPVATLRHVHRLLRPGGVVALKTPKFRGPASRWHGREWNGFRLGYHTFVYTGRTLSACLAAAGFETLSSPRRDRILDDILVLWGRTRAAIRRAVPSAA